MTVSIWFYKVNIFFLGSLQSYGKLLITLILKDGPDLWKATHKNGESMRKKK